MGMGRFGSALLLSFGGPENSDDVMPFLRNVTAGRGVPDERLAVVAEQYELFGGKSPINELNQQLLSARRRVSQQRSRNGYVFGGTATGTHSLQTPSQISNRWGTPPLFVW